MTILDTFLNNLKSPNFWGLTSLQIGLLLVVMAYRFRMVKNSLEGGWPSPKRLITLKREYSITQSVGYAIVFIGLLGELLFIFADRAKIIATVGGIGIFTLGIPSKIQLEIAKKGEKEKDKSLRNLYVWSLVCIIAGIALTAVSFYLSAV
jgi:hypothetical protein